jgi:hypothetical protein
MRKRPDSISFSKIGNIVFWTSCLLYFRFAVFPPLIAERQEPVFLSGRAFLDGIFFHPGGFAEYLSLFLTRCLEFAWPGAVLLTALAGCFSLAWRFAARRTAGTESPAGVPALLLTALFAGLHGHYPFRIATDIGLLLAFISAGAVLFMGRGREWLTVLIVLALAPVLYGLAGGAFLIFLSWMWIRAIFGSRIGAPVRAVTVFGLPAFGWFLPRLFDPASGVLAPEYSLFRWLPFHGGFPVPFQFHVFIGSIILIEISLLLYGRRNGMKTAESGEKSRPSSRLAGWGRRHPAIVKTAESVIPLLLLAATAVFSPDRSVRSGLLIRHRMHRGEWNAVLAEALRNPGYDKSTAFLVNRAMERLGVMGEELFRYSQKWGLDGLIPLKEQALAEAMDYSDLWFELGDVNEAEHWAHEAWTQKGETPAVLERLAQVNLIKNNRVMAESAVRLMEKSPFMKAKAEYYRRLLENPEALSGDAEIANAVFLRPKKDFIVRLHLPEAEVVALMRQNPANRQAFEFFMAYTMLSRELYLFVQEFGRINGFGYAHIPTRWEEALIMYMIGKGQREPVFAGRAIRQETIRRFNDFQGILTSFNNDRISAKNALAGKYGDTYWFFLLYTEPNARPDSGSTADSVTGATGK